MFQNSPTFSSISVNDIKKAKEFYGETLGLKIDEDEKMGLEVEFFGGGKMFIYEKLNHEPASFTVLNFIVEDIDKAVEDLETKGIKFEHYDSPELHQDEKGIGRGKEAGMGPNIAWFKDPAGNVIAVLEV